MAAAGKTFRVFISSTFDDMAEERDALQRRVFPKLRETCTAQGCTFQAIDLRWGVSQEAGLAQRTMSICLEEIERCRAVTPRPNFVLLLGDRYGWQPLPESIDARDAAALAEQMPPSDRTLFEEWYREDGNADPPVRYLRPRTLQLPDGADAETELAARAKEQKAWRAVEKELRRALHQATERATANGIPQSVRLVSAVEWEADLGVFDSPEAAEHVVCVLREGALGSPFDETDPQAKARQQALRERLAKKLAPANVLRVTAQRKGDRLSKGYLEAISDALLRRLTELIESQIHALKQRDDLQDEIEAHRDFIDQAFGPDDLVGREDQLAELKEMAGGSTGTIVWIGGDPGMGKTAFLAVAAREVGRCNPGAVVAERHVGATAASGGLTGLLEPLCRQIAAAYDDPRPVPREVHALVARWRELLGVPRIDRRLFVAIDGAAELLNATEEHAPDWIPVSLPAGVTLALTGPTAMVEERHASAPGVRTLKLGPLTLDQFERALDRRLKQAGRKLTDEQRTAVLYCCEADGSPAFLHYAFERARRWRSHERPSLGSTTEKLIDEAFASLEAPESHGSIIVRRTLGFLAASRNGLSEDELLRLLSDDAATMEFLRARSAARWRHEVTHVPVAVWARLAFDLRPYLRERTAGQRSLLTFADDRAKRIALQRAAESAAELRQLHQSLAAFFRSDADPAGNATWTGSSDRGFRELAHHYACDVELAQSVDCASGKALGRLSADEVFRERQFLVTKDAAPLHELSRLALEVALRFGSRADLVEAALRRLYLAGSLHRTLAHRLYAFAAEEPHLAEAAIALLPNASDRIAATAFCVWIEWKAPETQERAKHRLRGLLDDREATVHLHHVPLLVSLALALAQSGLAEALRLVQFVPDSPQRDCYVESWSDLTDERGEIARVLGSELPRRTASAEECERLGSAVRFARLHSHGGFMMQGTWFHNLMEAMERRAYAELGERSLSRVYAVWAADLLDQRQLTMFELFAARSFGETRPMGRDRHPLTQLAIDWALSQAGRSELGKEHRARLETTLLHPMTIATNSSTLNFYGPIYEEAKRRCTPYEMSMDPAMSKLEAAVRKTPADASPEGRFERLFLEAGLEANFGSEEAALGKLDEAERASSGKALPAAERLAVEKLRSSLDPSRIQPGSPAAVSQRTEIATAGPAAVFAYCSALRRTGQTNELCEMLRLICHKGRPESIDAAIAQIPLEPGVTVEELGAVSDALDRAEPALGIGSGMGMYYFAAPWMRATLLGMVFVGIAGFAHASVGSMGVIVLAGIVGGLGDLAMWRILRVWQFPERARRTAAEGASYLAAFLALQTEYPVLSRLFKEEYAFYGLAAFVAAAAALAAWPAVASYRLGFGLKTGERYAIAALAVTVAVVAAVLSTWFVTPTWEPLLAGCGIAGACAIGLGLNLGVKHFPVKRYYDAKGVRADGGGGLATLRQFETPLDGEQREETPFARKVSAAQRLLARRRFAEARSAFDDLIQDPALVELPVRQRASILINCGVCGRKLGDGAGALARYDEASRLEPDAQGPYQNAGLVLAQDLRQFAKALPLFDLAHKCDPINSEILSSRSNVKCELHDVPGAVADLQLALRLDPSNADAMFNLALIRGRMQGNHHEAARLLGEALKRAPHDLDTRLQYAASLATCGRMDEADQVARADPRCAIKWMQAKAASGARDGRA